ncbi:GcrA family cell cycle regulator [Jiella sp. M17.18]|uniref:GcrA family cell cycle regulator n=1 Tax=Jiella sp. M17.18 TaxID=3234247 RepID=UPI0034DFF094
MGWTDERIALLKQLWTEGLSASQIADRLGGVSRNAVIGKVHRLKLESRARTPGVAAPQPVPQAQPVVAETVREEVVEVAMPRVVASQPAPTMVRPAMPRSVGATALKVEMEPEFETEADAEPQRQSGEVVPIARKLTLVQLNDRTCKWPVGDPLQPDFHFCGNHSGDASPYCTYHAKLAFQAVERRRVR